MRGRSAGFYRRCGSVGVVAGDGWCEEGAMHGVRREWGMPGVVPARGGLRGRGR